MRRIALARSRSRRHLSVLVVLMVLSPALGSCSDATEPQPRSKLPASARLVVSLGDSYAVGYRPVSPGVDASSADNLPAAVASGLSTKARTVRVVNFACAQATSLDLVSTNGCPQGRGAPGSPAYDETTQADAAVSYIRNNRSRIRAVTMVIGGNDINACISIASGRVSGDPTSCVGKALAALQSRLASLLPRLRSAAGKNVPIIGLTYPDVYLGLAIGDTRAVARASVRLFRKDLNPILAKAYRAVDGRFVDVTAAFGGYIPLTRTTRLPPYGKIPKATARVCRLTYACSQQDIHTNLAGQRLIATKVAAAIRSAS